MNRSTETAVPAPHRVSFGQTLFSVAASFFGVQSSKNRARDFTYGNPWAFIWVGLGMTAAFVFSLLLFVRILMRSAGM